MSENTLDRTIKAELPSWALYTERYFEALLSTVLLGLIFIIILSDIIRRTIFGTQLLGGFEIAIGLFIWIAWLTPALAVRHESHFRFTLLRKKMSRNTNMVMFVVEWALWLLVIGTIFWYSIPKYQDYMLSGRYLVGTPIQEHWIYLAIPFSTALILLRVVQNIYIKINQFRNGEEITPDADIGAQE